MNNRSFSMFLLLSSLAILAFSFWMEKRDQPSSGPAISTAVIPLSASTSSEAFDGKNATFVIEGKAVTLSNGDFETPAAPDSASKVTVRYFGNTATGDLNGDGMPDTAFLVTQDNGGSGTFYYVVAALHTANGWKTTNAFFIGDRIAPQTTEIRSDSKELLVNYAERKQGEPMTASPSQGATLFLKVTPDGILTQVVQ